MAKVLYTGFEGLWNHSDTDLAVNITADDQLNKSFAHIPAFKRIAGMRANSTVVYNNYETGHIQYAQSSLARTKINGKGCYLRGYSGAVVFIYPSITFHGDKLSGGFGFNFWQRSDPQLPYAYFSNAGLTYNILRFNHRGVEYDVRVQREPLRLAVIENSVPVLTTALDTYPDPNQWMLVQGFVGNNADNEAYVTLSYDTNTISYTLSGHHPTQLQDEINISATGHNQQYQYTEYMDDFALNSNEITNVDATTGIPTIIGGYNISKTTATKIISSAHTYFSGGDTGFGYIGDTQFKANTNTWAGSSIRDDDGNSVYSLQYRDYIGYQTNRQQVAELSGAMAYDKLKAVNYSVSNVRYNNKNSGAHCITQYAMMECGSVISNKVPYVRSSNNYFGGTTYNMRNGRFSDNFLPNEAPFYELDRHRFIIRQQDGQDINEIINTNPKIWMNTEYGAVSSVVPYQQLWARYSTIVPMTAAYIYESNFDILSSDTFSLTGYNVNQYYMRMTNWQSMVGDVVWYHYMQGPGSPVASKTRKHLYSIGGLVTRPKNGNRAGKTTGISLSAVPGGYNSSERYDTWYYKRNATYLQPYGDAAITSTQGFTWFCAFEVTQDMRWTNLDGEGYFAGTTKSEASPYIFYSVAGNSRTEFYYARGQNTCRPYFRVGINGNTYANFDYQYGSGHNRELWNGKSGWLLYSGRLSAQGPYEFRENGNVVYQAPYWNVTQINPIKTWITLGGNGNAWSHWGNFGDFIVYDDYLQDGKYFKVLNHLKNKFGIK